MNSEKLTVSTADSTCSDHISSGDVYTSVNNGISAEHGLPKIVGKNKHVNNSEGDDGNFDHSEIVVKTENTVEVNIPVLEDSNLNILQIKVEPNRSCDDQIQKKEIVSEYDASLKSERTSKNNKNRDICPCRVCQLDGARVPLFDGQKPRLNDKLMAFTTIKILKGDGLPQFVCFSCASEINSAYNLKILCEKSDTAFREKLGLTHKKRAKRKIKNVDHESCDTDSSSDDLSVAKYRRKSKKTKKSKTHKDKSLGRLYCSHCQRNFNYEKAYKQHMAKHDKGYKCPFCKEVFKDEASLDVHRPTHVRVVTPSEVPKITELRGLNIDKAGTESKRKIEIVHGRPSVFTSVYVPGCTPTFKCPICSLVFSSSKKLASHNLNSHAENKTVPGNVKSAAVKLEEPSTNQKKSKPSTIKDLFKTIAPLTTTYWSDSFSD